MKDNGSTIKDKVKEVIISSKRQNYWLDNGQMIFQNQEYTPKFKIQIYWQKFQSQIIRKKYFTDPYFLPNLPSVSLVNPTEVVKNSMENVKKLRGFYRSLHLPLEDMFQE